VVRLVLGDLQPCEYVALIDVLALVERELEDLAGHLGLTEIACTGTTYPFDSRAILGLRARGGVSRGQGSEPALDRAALPAQQRQPFIGPPA